MQRYEKKYKLKAILEVLHYLAKIIHHFPSFLFQITTLASIVLFKTNGTAILLDSSAKI